jgi:exosome complex component CSL4
MEVEAGGFVCPGQRIARLGEFEPGEGTYIRQNFIFASVVGNKEIVQSEEKKILSVKKGKEPSIVPDEHSIVTGRVRSKERRKKKFGN